MRVLVCGGRDFNGAAWLASVLGDIHARTPISQIIHGAYRGADACAAAWAVAHGIPDRPFPADWKRRGRRAGPERNQRMLDKGRPDLVVAFPGGAGTADMVAKAKAAGVRVMEAVTPSRSVSL